MNRLIEILMIARPHGGPGEQKLADMLTKYEPDVLYDGTDPMAYIVNIGESKTIFSAHLDTAESKEGAHALVLETKNDVVATILTDGKSILGADDGAGVWLLMEMIDAGVPGCYIFTVGEECGGIGAKHVATVLEHMQSDYDRAVAFDRRGIDSVITHQFRGRCCSDEFANALGAALNENMGGEGFYAPDDTGSYTDTAEYTGILSECTNISCGYRHEHTHQETLDVAHLMRLRNAVLKVDWESLPTRRDPKVVELDPWWANKPGFVGYKYEEDDVPTSAFDITQMEHRDLMYWIERADPRDIAALMYEMAADLVYGSDVEVVDDDDDDHLNVGMC